MTSHAFVLEVPTDARFRSVIPDVASRFVELIGGAKGDGAALAEALVVAVNEIVKPSGDSVELKFVAKPDGVSVALRCGGRTSVVRHPLPAGRS